MSLPHRPVAFIIASTNHGTMIINRHDYNVSSQDVVYGVGHLILKNASYDTNDVGFLRALLTLRRQYFGDGVLAIDGGANIGVYSIEWGRLMYGWGAVICFEAQEIIYYALAGNVVVNNCLNVRARLAALGRRDGELAVPVPNYFRSGSFGSLELRQHRGTEFIGQHVSYDPAACAKVPMIAIDSLRLDRVDLIKLDVEGMEEDVLLGASETIALRRPILSVEIIKSDRESIERFLADNGYRFFPAGFNLIAIHIDDPVLKHIGHQDGVTFVT